MNADAPPKNRITVGITGASGAIYAIRTLRALLIAGLRVDVICSEFGWMLLRDEAGFDGKRGELGAFVRATCGADVEAGTLTVHDTRDLAAPISSGSVASRGMVIVPCSMKSLSGVAQGASTNLIERAADVTLKERRTLVIVPRETPMNLIHLRNMVAVAEAGAVVVPAMPAFYQKPETMEDLADFIAGRILNLFGVAHALFPTWKGE